MMIHDIHFAAPPMLARRLKSDIETAFPDHRLTPPCTHLEMFEAAGAYGRSEAGADGARPPVMTITAYPQLLTRVVEEGAAVAPLAQLALPPLRPEIVAAGLTPPHPDVALVAVVPLVPAVDRRQLPDFRGWDDLRPLIEAGHGVAAPPDDTPLPYLLSAFLARRWGLPEARIRAALDRTSPPLEINKRLAAGDVAAGLLPPAFCRNSRGGEVRLVWPADGALAAPVIAVLSPSAPCQSRDLLRSLLFPAMQRAFADLGGMVPVIDGIPGPAEMEAAGWSLLPTDWTDLLDQSRTMSRQLLQDSK